MEWSSPHRARDASDGFREAPDSITERRLTATDIRVLLLEGNPPCLEGLAIALARQTDIVVTGLEPLSPHVSARLRATRPHVLLVALQGLKRTTMEAIQVGRAMVPGMGIIAVAPQPCSSLLAKAASMGASACIAADAPAEYAASMVRRVYQGEHPLRHELPPRDRERFPLPAWTHTPPPLGPSAALSPRELQILQQIALGLANKQIAHNLRLSEQTVKNHVSGILRKVGAHDRAHAVYLAFQCGWIPSSRFIPTAEGSPAASY